MASNIDTTIPRAGNADTSRMRAQFGVIKREMEALQEGVAALNAALQGGMQLPDAAVQLDQLAAIAFSGSYFHLRDRPRIPAEAADVRALPISGGQLTGPLSLAADATSALEATTLQQLGAALAALATVARSGRYADLLEKPTLGTAAATDATAYATAQQGARADSALQPADIAAALTKLDGIEGGAQVNTVHSVNGQQGSVVLDAASVGLGLVDNTADVDKPVSTAQQAALATRAPLASPALTGTPTAPTAQASSNTDQLATTAFVQRAVAALVEGSPATLNTLNELAAALGNDPNFATSMSTLIGTKLDASAYTAADVLAKLKTLDGTGSGLDADLLDGKHASDFATSTQGAKADTAVQPATLATVATTGAYGDLSGRPSALSQFTNDLGLITADDVPASPVTSVNSKTGTVVLTATDVGAATTGHSHGVATTAAPGFMAAADKAKLDGLAGVATSGSYPDLTNKPALGTAAAKDVPATGNATTAQVVLGNDSRLSDARPPTAHGHAIGDVAGLQSALDGKLPTTGTAAAATKLATARAIALTGDVTGSANFDGTAGISISVSYKSSGVAAGTYSKVTVDSKGNVTGGSALAAADIPALDASKITGGTFADARLPARLGAVAATISDWDAATSNGWYMASNAINAPQASTWFIGHVENHGAVGWCTQTVHAFSGDLEADTKTWRREQNNGAWGAWYRLRVSEAEQSALYLQKVGDTLTGKLTTAAPATGSAGLGLPHGTTPTTLANGDTWTTTSGMYVRINGVTRDLYHSGNLADVSQAEAEAGTATSRRAWSALRVRQAIAAYANTNIAQGVLPPVNALPAAGALGVSTTEAQLQGSAFATVGAADVMAAAHWQIATDPDFINIIYDSGEVTA